MKATPDPFVIGFSIRLRVAMAKRNVTPSELGTALGYSCRTVSQWRWGHGRYIPRPFILVEIADHLDVTVDWLLGRTLDPAMDPTYRLEGL